MEKSAGKAENESQLAKNTVDGMQIRTGGKGGSTNSENMRGNCEKVVWR